MNLRFREIKAAKEFSKLPHEWDKAPVMSRAEAIAFTEVQGLIESYGYEKMEEKRESQK